MPINILKGAGYGEMTRKGEEADDLIEANGRGGNQMMSGVDTVMMPRRGV